MRIRDRQPEAAKPTASRPATLLVDGNFLLKRSLHSKSYHGRVMSNYAAYHFLILLRKLAKEYDINKVVVSWDGDDAGVQRYAIYPDYKSNRVGKTWDSSGKQLSQQEVDRQLADREQFIAQRKWVRNALEHLFVRQLWSDGIESDDIIAAYCRDYGLREDIIVFTNDRDITQVLGFEGNIRVILSNINLEVREWNEFMEAYQNVRVYRPIDRSNFRDIFGFHWGNTETMKVLCGDPSDCIPKVYRLSEEELLKRYPRLTEERMGWGELVASTCPSDSLSMNILLGLTNEFYSYVSDVALCGVWEDGVWTYRHGEAVWTAEARRRPKSLEKSLDFTAFCKLCGYDVQNPVVRSVIDAFRKGGGVCGDDFYRRNHRLVSLAEPLLDDESRSLIVSMADDYMLFDDEEMGFSRGGRMLRDILFEGDILSAFRNIPFQEYRKDGVLFNRVFMEFCTPFIPIIRSELECTISKCEDESVVNEAKKRREKLVS